MSRAGRPGTCACGCRGEVKPNRRWLRSHDKRKPFSYEVDKTTDCWIWSNGKTAGGYGRFRNQYAHRVSYEREYGPIPRGQEIDHLCRNRACVNPSHLEAVTTVENNHRGKATKLAPAAVKEMRRARVELKAELAERFGICPQHVDAIWREGRWHNTAVSA